MTTARDVAEWMLAELDRQREFYQEDAVDEIEHKFGDNSRMTTIMEIPLLILRCSRHFETSQVMMSSGNVALACGADVNDRMNLADNKNDIQGMTIRCTQSPTRGLVDSTAQRGHEFQAKYSCLTT